MRFNTVPGKEAYQHTDTSNQKRDRRILFGGDGGKALVIENNFQQLTSNIGSGYEPYFVFGDELMQKNKVDSIIPEVNVLQTPT